jgi:FkbM family methyltransferase
VHLVDRVYGLCRSLWMYYGRPGGGAALDRFYAGLVPRGGQCFDVGAHVGSRSRSWSRLGASVVAIEPQPDFARFLRWLFRRDAKVTVREEAVAAFPGTLTLLVSSRTPTVTTGSRRFIASAASVPSFDWVRWDASVEVTATTLDELIGSHGTPDFAKIDVEGMEHEVLAGLSRPLPAISFEFVPSAMGSALASLARLETLGRYAYNVSLGESLAMEFAEWVDVRTLRAWLEGRDPAGDSGDIYARSRPADAETAAAVPLGP